MIDLLEIEDLIDPTTCRKIVSTMAAADGDAAFVYGTSKTGSVEPTVRKVTRVAMPDEINAVINDLLDSQMNDLSRQFDVQLTSFEEPQFLRYAVGDHFVAHQDGNTPLVYDDTRFRKVSIVIFLNERSPLGNNDTYRGGSLVLHGAFPDYDDRRDVPCKPGTLAAFRSETTHEVTPVTGGKRFTIVSWYR